MFEDADLTFDDATDEKGQKHKLTSGSYIPMLMGHDRVLRESAFKQLYGRYNQFRNTSQQCLSQIKQLSSLLIPASTKVLLHIALIRTRSPLRFTII